jgi:hypothetical protein
MSNLSQRREEMDPSEMYKIMTRQSAVGPGVWFENVNRDGEVTRQAARLRQPDWTWEKNFFSVRVREKWNNLPSDIKSSVKVKCFNTNYRRHTGSNPSQAADDPEDGTSENNGTRLDEPFTEEPGPIGINLQVYCTSEQALSGDCSFNHLFLTSSSVPWMTRTGDVTRGILSILNGKKHWKFTNKFIYNPLILL